MSLSINQTPTKTVSTTEGVSLYTSMWTAVHNPIVFKLTSTLFPVADLGNTVTFVTVSESALGNAVLTWSTNPDVPPSDLVPGLYIKVEGAVYSGEFQIVNYGGAFNTLEINTPFISSDTGTIQRAYRNYVVDLKVFAGLPDAHKWKALKPEVEVEVLQQIPNASNIAIFDIQEAVKQKVNTNNDFTLESLPNDINIWTGFRVSYQESYNTYEGVIGVSDLITAASDQGGNQRFTTTNDIGLNTGDYVQLQGFTDGRFNGGVFKVISTSGLNVDLNILYSGSIVLNGAETMEQFSISLATFESGFTEEGNQYYAVNSKLNPRSAYGGNLGEYLLTDNSGLSIPFLSGFEGKKAYKNKRDEVFLLVDKSFTDFVPIDFTLEVTQKDRNKSTITNSIFSIPNEDEGVYRVNYLGNFLITFVSIWDTLNTSAGSSTSTQISLPLIATGTYNFVVDWGDGTQDTITSWNQPETTHTYNISGVKSLTINGVITGWQFNNTGDRNKILSISNWGRLNINNDNAFYGCSNLTLKSVSGLPFLSGNTLNGFFRGCTSLDVINGLDSWDVSNVTDFSNLFNGCTSFNQDLSSWDISSANLLSFMFANCPSFNNGNLAGSFGNSMTFVAYPSASCRFAAMFFNCIVFNQNLSSWDVSKSNSFASIFQLCTVFNNGESSGSNTAPLNWDMVGNTCPDFAQIFDSAPSFNQDVSTWIVSSGTNFGNAFVNSNSFNQSLASWDISNMINGINMLQNTAINTANYDAILIAWDSLTVQSGITLGVNGLTYTAAGAGGTARASLITNDSWTFVGDNGI